MYARSTTVRGKRDRIDQSIAMVRDEVLPAVTQMPGCRGLSMLVDREAAEGIVTTSWDSREAMSATAEAVAPMREKAANLIGGTAEVQEWEVAVMHRDHHTAPGTCCRSTWFRTSTDADAIERGIDVYKLGVVPKLEVLDGFCSALLLIDRATGLGVSTVAYDDRAALANTRSQVKQIRSGALQEMGAELVDVREHDLLIAHLHVPEMA